MIKPKNSFALFLLLVAPPLVETELAMPEVTSDMTFPADAGL